jgi:hypothetical protein
MAFDCFRGSRVAGAALTRLSSPIVIFCREHLWSLAACR